jgi:hypothetical protein
MENLNCQRPQPQLWKPLNFGKLLKCSAHGRPIDLDCGRPQVEASKTLNVQKLNCGRPKLWKTNLKKTSRPSTVEELNFKRPSTGEDTLTEEEPSEDPQL